MGSSTSKQVPLTYEEYMALPASEQQDYKSVKTSNGVVFVKKSKYVRYARATGRFIKDVLSDEDVRALLTAGISVAADVANDVIVEEINIKLKDPESNLSFANRQRLEMLKNKLEGAGGVTGGAYHALAEHYGGAITNGQIMFGGGNGISGAGNGNENGISGSGCGCGAFLGGNESDELEYSAIRDYADSLNSATKQNLVEDIVKILVSMGFKVDGDTTQDKLKAIMNILPNPKNNKSFKADAEKHEKLCRMIANSINLRFGEQIIDEKADPIFICQAVAEIIYSLTAGMHLEFIMIQNSVKKIIKNIGILKQQMTRIYKPFAETVLKLNPQARGKLTNHKAIYEMLDTEIQRQLKMLNDLLNIVISPAELKLEKLIKKGDMKSMIMKVGEYKPGDSRFGQTIANLLNGLGVTAEFASLTEDALKRVGLTLKQYADSEGIKILSEHLAKTVLDKEMTPKELEEFMQNADFLIKNISRAKSIEEMQARQNISGGNFSIFGGEFNPTPKYDEDQFAKSNVDRRISINRDVKKLIFQSFARLVDEQMYRIATSLEFFAEKIGSGIPLTPELDGFKNALIKLQPLIMYRQSYIVLIGYFNDALSKQRRETFISEMRMIKHYAEAMANMSVYSSVMPHLKEIINSIDSMIKLIDEYSDKIEKKYGSARRPATKEHGIIYGGDEHDEEQVCNAIDVKGGFQDEYEGGEDEIYGGDIKGMPTQSVMRKVPRSLAKITQKFDYYYKVAQIKENLKHAGKELEIYAEKYGEIRAESIAKKINLIKDWKDDKIGKLKTISKELVVDYPPSKDPNVQDPKNVYVNKMCECTGTFIGKYAIALSNFWRTVEAVDEYMRVFTNNMVKNINDIQEIKNMLDETEVVYDWYTKETGKHICNLFEKFPCYIEGDSKLNKDDNTSSGKRLFSNYASESSAHYYENVGSNYNTKTPAVDLETLIPYLPGNPYISLDADDNNNGFSGVEQIDKIMRNFIVLKNIMSIFINIGDKFGKNTVHKQIFMSPVQIYRNLVDFIKYCSFGIGLKTFSSPADDNNLTLVSNDKSSEIAIGEILVGNKNTYNMAGNDTFPTNVVFASGFNKSKALTKFREEFGIYMRSSYKNLQGGVIMEEADEMFVLVIKSMCAKILTVVGMYDLMSRPTEKIYMSPVRFIIGGNFDNPDIIEPAVELYVRLPLLAEFYRRLFDFYGEEGTSEFLNMEHREKRAEKISMMPEAEGNFSGLVKLVFRKSRGINVKNYSDIEIKELIKCINEIWNKLHSAGGSDPVGYIIREFVKEINMRYGLIAKKEQEKYDGIQGERFRYQELTKFDTEFRDVDVPILPDEESVVGEHQQHSMAPSRKYEKAGEMSLEAYKEKQTPYFIIKEHRILLNRFRCLIDSYFRKNLDDTKIEDISDDTTEPYELGKAKEIEKISLRPSIKSAKMQLKEEKDPNMRYRIISKIVKGDDIVTHADSMKYVMFHETVITGLTVLSYIHTLLTKYQILVLVTDLDSIKKNVGNANFDEGDVNAFLAKEYQPKGTQSIKTTNTRHYNSSKGNFATTVKANNILEDIITFASLFHNNTNGLVEVQIGQDSINVNFTRLKEVVNKIFEHIKYFWDVFKLTFTPDEYKTLYETYIKKEAIGSLYWLHEQIVEKLFVGRDKVVENKALEVDNLVPYVNLDKLNIILSKTFRILLETKEFKYGQLYAGLIFYNNQLENNGILGDTALVSHAVASGIDYLSPMGKLFMLDNGTKQVVYPKYSNRFDELYTFNEDKPNNNTSLLFSFNQLLARYLNMCYDKANDKIYINTISGLINGPLNRAIMDVENQTYPDYAPGETVLKIISATGGDIDKSALIIYTNAQSVGNVSTQEKLVELANRVEIAYGTGKNYANFGALNSAISDPKWPKFFVDAVVLSQSKADAIPSDQLAAYIDKSYKLYFKNASYFIAKTETSVQKDIPVSVNVSDQTKNNATSQFTKRSDPHPDKILYTTLALIMRNMLYSKNQANQTPIYTLDNIAEVSPYIKETFRAGMPFFKQQFKSIISKCNMLKNVMSMEKMNLTRIIAGNANDYNDLSGLLSTEGKTGSEDKTHNLNHFSSILDSIIRASNAVISCIDNVLREIPDDPKYFELYSGSIQEYRAINGKEPFMPISSVFAVPSILGLGLNGFSIGSTKFKLFYGTRGLFGRQNAKVTQENTPGPFQILDMYNMMVSEKESIDKPKLNGFLDNFVDVMKLINDMFISSKNIYNKINNKTFDEFTAVMIPPDVKDNRALYSTIKVVDRAISNKLYQLNITNSTVVSLTESSFKDMSMKRISNHVTSNSNTSSDSLDIINILDLNIIPINIHALMRDIPLANLYNYAYTFDRLIVELYYGIQDNFGNMLIWHLCSDENTSDPKYPKGSFDRYIVGETIDPYADSPNDAKFGHSTKAVARPKSIIKSPKELMLAMLLKPYREIVTNLEYKFIKQTFIGGDTNLPLGRPKFLSEQLYNKSLFGELRDNRTYAYRPVAIDEREDKLVYPVETSFNKNYGEVRPSSQVLKEVTLDANVIKACKFVGKLRYNTIFVRNLQFLVNLYRSLRLKLHQDLTYNKDIVVKSHALTRADNTEFNGWQQQSYSAEFANMFDKF